MPSGKPKNKVYCYEGHRKLIIKDPVTWKDERNAGRRSRYRWLPGFVARRLWPVAYEWLTPEELAEKRTREFVRQGVMNRSVFGVVDETPRSTTFEGIDSSPTVWWRSDAD